MGIMKNRLVFVFEIFFIFDHFWLFFRFFGSKNTQKNRNFQFFLILDKNLKNKNQTFFHYAHRDLYTKFQVDILKNEKLVRVWNFKSYRRFSEKGSKFEKILIFFHICHFESDFLPWLSALALNTTFQQVSALWKGSKKF